MSNKILVVDDDDALREMVGLVLNAAGYHTVFAADGLSAVDVFKSEEPDLVLLDIMLPGQSGIEVCKQIRSLSGTPIVMLTAKSDTEDVVTRAGTTTTDSYSCTALGYGNGYGYRLGADGVGCFGININIDIIIV